MAHSFQVEEHQPPKGVSRHNTFADAYATTYSKSFVGEVAKHPTLFEGGNSESVPGEGGSLTVWTASFNLANNIIGAGLVGLSFVATGAGLIPFVLFMTGAGISTVLTLDMLAAAGDMVGVKDFEYVATRAYGKLGKAATASVVIAQCYGACIAYLVLISLTAPVFGKVIGFESDPVVLQVVITIVVVLPLCCLRDLSALSSSAIFALCVYLSVAIYTIYSGFTDTWYADGKVGEHEACPAEGILWFGTDPVSIVKNFPTILFAFVCHPTLLPVFKELNGEKYEDQQKVDKLSIAMAYGLYVSVGTFGYVAYTNNTFSSVLLNLRHCVCTEYAGEWCASSCKKMECADDNNMASILNACFLLAVLTGYPSVHFALRRSLIAVFWGSEKEFSWSIHLGIAFVNVFGTLVIAVVAADVSVVFNWAGSIASPMVSYILPGLFFTKMVNTSNVTYQGIGPGLAYGMASVGAVMMVVGIGLQLNAL